MKSHGPSILNIVELLRVNSNHGASKDTQADVLTQTLQKVFLGLKHSTTSETY